MDKIGRIYSTIEENMSEIKDGESDGDSPVELRNSKEDEQEAKYPMK